MDNPPERYSPWISTGRFGGSVIRRYPPPGISTRRRPWGKPLVQQHTAEFSSGRPASLFQQARQQGLLTRDQWFGIYQTTRPGSHLPLWSRHHLLRLTIRCPMVRHPRLHRAHRRSHLLHLNHHFSRPCLFGCGCMGRRLNNVPSQPCFDAYRGIVFVPLSNLYCPNKCLSLLVVAHD